MGYCILLLIGSFHNLSSGKCNSSHAIFFINCLLLGNSWQKEFCMKKYFTFKRHLLVSVFFLFCSLSAFATDNLIYSQVQINVEKAGTLSTLVGDDRKFRITNLKLSGELNGEDIKWLREMAGNGTTNGAVAIPTTDGKLAKLDMTDATLLSSYDFYLGSERIENDNEIGRGMFTRCTTLVSVKLPKSTVKIGEFAFDYCNNLESIAIPDQVTEMGQDCFNHCPSLASIILPSALEKLGEYAFASCTSLKSITLPNRLTKINDGMFRSCGALSNIVMPSSIKSIGSSCFEKCSNLKSVYISDMRSWCGIDFYSKWSNPMVNGANLYLNGKELKELSIPVGVKSIKKNAFFGCTSLEAVIIPNTVDSIREYSFSGCTNLKTIKCFNNVPPVIASEYSNSASWTSITESATSDSKITLYVPSGCKDAYKKCNVWKNMTINEGYHGEYHLSDINNVLPVGIYPIGDLDYTRDQMMPGTYESFCLPFDISVNEYLAVFEDVYVPNDMALLQNEAKLLLTLKSIRGIISAGQPFFAKIKNKVTTVTFTNKNFVNNKVEVMPNPNVIYPQVYNWDGTSGILIANTLANIGIAGMYYSMRDTGMKYEQFKNNGNFESVENEGYLPYRVYVTKANDYTESMVKQITLGVEDDGVNGIKQLILLKENQCNAVYGADGRLINTTGSLEGLPSGVYIKNHKKILVK